MRTEKSTLQEKAPDDDALMQRVARGDEEAFVLLIERYQGLVRGTIHRMGWQNQDMEDLAQEVFLRVWKAARRYQPDGKFPTWLLTITRNVVFNASRVRSKAPTTSMDSESVSPEVAAIARPEHERPDAQAQSIELRRAVDEALAALPKKQVMALVLHRFEGLPHEEIARILGTSVPSVKSLIFRAREHLRTALRTWLPCDDCRND